MTEILITGADGFVGGHLIDFLLSQGHEEIHGTTYLSVENYPDLSNKGIKLWQVDLRDEKAVERLLGDIRPREIYHLAAKSFIPESFRDPWGTLENNIRSQLNILEWIRNLRLDTRLLLVGSSDVYGPVKPEDVPISETQPFKPANPYSVSKVAQDMLGLQYYLSYGIQIIRVRPFNQIGPGQNKAFVVPAFASQIAEIEASKKEPVVQVGNLTAQRDFTDVRDMVRAFSLLMKHGSPGDVYNVGSGEPHSIREVLETLLSFSTTPITIREDKQLFRPSDVPILICDPLKVTTSTGWKREIPFADSLKDVLVEWRQRLNLL